MAVTVPLGCRARTLPLLLLLLLLLLLPPPPPVL